VTEPSEQAKAAYPDQPYGQTYRRTQAKLRTAFDAGMKAGRAEVLAKIPNAVLEQWAWLTQTDVPVEQENNQ
jgi:hypothetical protein